MSVNDRECEALSRLAAAGASPDLARELAPDLAELSRSLRQARERLSSEWEPATIYRVDGR